MKIAIILFLLAAVSGAPHEGFHGDGHHGHYHHHHNWDCDTLYHRYPHQGPSRPGHQLPVQQSQQGLESAWTASTIKPVPGSAPTNTPNRLGVTNRDQPQNFGDGAVDERFGETHPIELPKPESAFVPKISDFFLTHGSVDDIENLIPVDPPSKPTA